MKCKKCGSPQGRKPGKCWEEGLCRKCFIYKKPLECKNCGATSNHITGLCWKQDLCGYCYKLTQKTMSFRPRTICSCGEALVAMMYQKRGIWINSGGKICTNCKTVFTVRDKYKYAMLLVDGSR